jgi:serine/threonine-protein kinase
LLARDEELDRPVAIKLLAENLAHDEELRKRFLREGRLAARLSHPNVVKVFDAGEDGGRPYIVMEHVEGETLADVLRRRRRLPVDEAVELALQACGGLAHAHASGLVHRDVKPQNLLLAENGTLKIADFGIARAVESSRLTQAGTILGTAAYLSPEQAAGEEVTAAADLYSLGVVLYELLVGRTPFTFASLAELASTPADRAIEPIRDESPEVPEALEDVVMRCLARNPSYRPESAAALARELEAAVGARRDAARTEPLPAAAGRPATRRHTARRWWMVAAVAVLAAGVVALAALTVTSGDNEQPPPPARVEPVPRGDTAADQARNLAAWLRRNSTR